MEEYEPFSEEWEKHIYKYVNKKNLIAIYKKVCIENKALKEAYKTHLEGINKLPLAAIHNLARSIPFVEFETEILRQVGHIATVACKCSVCSSEDVFTFASIHSKCRTCKQQWTD